MTRIPRLPRHSSSRVAQPGSSARTTSVTIDDELIEPAQRFNRDAVDDDTPFFVWFNTTGMHFRTHIADEIRGQAGHWQSE